MFGVTSTFAPKKRLRNCWDFPNVNLLALQGNSDVQTTSIAGSVQSGAVGTALAVTHGEQWSCPDTPRACVCGRLFIVFVL